MLDIIKDKGKQKSFCVEHGIPTSPFTLYDDADAIRQAVVSGTGRCLSSKKSCTAGYDGKGVQVVRTKDDLDKLLPGASLAEELIPLKKNWP